MINLKIDPEFQSQIPPLTNDEFKQLEENILKEGKLISPLIVWGNTLVDGHNRYAILQKHPEIYFSTMPLPFESREEVLAWICKNQLGRRNLTPEQKKFLMGKQYSVEHRKPGGNGNNQHSMGFIIRPAGKELSVVANVAPAGDLPLSITRTPAGMVELTSAKKDAVICYSIDGSKKVQEYTEPVPMRNGGTIKAWYKDSKDISSTMKFEKIESIQTQVVYASSQESGEGDASHLTDGDPNTIWHTMYSVTVAKYPHWVDLDAGEVKEIKGFTYLPRQNGGNGNIKDYSIQVSMDGKEWGEPVNKGTFARDSKEKRVLFDKPVKARYIRFTALSEQNGQDFASGAEITILAN